MFKCSMQRKMNEAVDTSAGFETRERWAKRSGYSVKVNGAEEIYTLDTPKEIIRGANAYPRTLQAKIILWLDICSITVKIDANNGVGILKNSISFEDSPIAQAFKAGDADDLNCYLNSILAGAKSAMDSIANASSLLLSALSSK